MKTGLSKSKIIAGLQCEKRLWLDIHQPELAVVPASVEAAFASGHEVNDAARALYPGGRLIGFDDGIAGALAETERALAESPDATLFEATFAYKGVVVRVDILKKTKRGYELIEVKGSGGLKDPYYPDCAVQAWVLEGCGIAVERVQLAHIDKEFVYRGDGDYDGLLCYNEMDADIAEMKQEAPKWVSRFNWVVNGREPNITTGAHCETPYSCPFIEHCAGPSTDYPVACLPRGKDIAHELEAEGVTDIRDIPEGRLANDRQEWVRVVTASGKPELNTAAKKAIESCAYPRHYLDFETINFAVPIWKDTKPFQHLPFQWSCHIENKSGKMEHDDFLDTDGDAPMRAFIESLLDKVGKSGAIFVYSGFEKMCLNQLAARFPDLRAKINKVINRLVDLLPLARECYYHPDMRGSWSLKAVLPTIAPELDYGDLGEVQDGTAAGVAYREIIHPETEPARAKSLARDLRAYCERDTEALVALVRFLACEQSD